MITLRDYQDEIVADIRKHLRSGCSRVLAVAPTGAGKTVMFSYIAQAAVAKYNRVLIISHRTELLTQAGGTLSEFGINAEIITAKVNKPPKGAVFAAMTGTLKNRVSKKPEWLEWWNKIDIIIVDEAHRGEFGWLKDFEQGKVKLGFTATAKRSGKMRQLADEYDKMVNTVDVQDLINRGFLVPDRYFGVPTDITGVTKDNNGEFNSSQLADKFGTSTVYEGLIRNIRKYAANESTIVFCCNIQHTIETCVKLNEAGFKAKFVVSHVSKPSYPEGDGKAQKTIYKRKLEAYEFYQKYYDLYSGDRESIVSDWKSGQFDYLCNAGIFVEGFDHKATQCVILNLATTSDNKFLQMVGRGARIFEGKRYFKLLDFGANADRLGHYRAQRNYSLIHKVSDSEGVAGHKNCPKCDALVFASAKFCKYCDHEFEVVKKSRDVELEERSFDDPLEETAEDSGKSKQWVWRQIWIKGGEEALKEYGRKKGYHPYWYKMQMKRYKK